MKVDAVIDPPDVTDDELYETEIPPGDQVHVHPGWTVRNTGQRTLRVYVYGTDTEVYVWQPNGKESLYGEMAANEGHPDFVVTDAGNEVRQDVLQRGALTVLRTSAFTS